MSEVEPQHKEIGDRLECIRKAFSDLKKKAFAESQGWNDTQYYNWVKGDRRIPVEAAEKLADRYELNLDFIYRGRVGNLSEIVLKKLEPHLPKT